MSEAQVAQSSPDVAPWLLQNDPRFLLVCVACGHVADHGLQSTILADDEAAPFLCMECVSDLAVAYVASSPDLRLIRVQVVEMPLAAPPPEDISISDISVTITWDPASDPRSVDIQVSPESQSAAAVLDLIEGALVRGCEYLSSYRGAAAEEDEVAS